jgi:hypothetical protein
VLPRPVLPIQYVIDQTTSPWGVRQVFNTPVLNIGQSFTPTFNSIDWVAFVFENRSQPGSPAGPGFVKVNLYSGISLSNGNLTGYLGSTETMTIAPETRYWTIFHFDDTIALTPGQRYYLQVEQVGGYQSWVAGRLDNKYFGGAVWLYFNNQVQTFSGQGELNFAQGIIADIVIPEPDGAATLLAGCAALGLRRR